MGWTKQKWLGNIPSLKPSIASEQEHFNKDISSSKPSIFTEDSFVFQDVIVKKSNDYKHTGTLTILDVNKSTKETFMNMWRLFAISNKLNTVHDIFSHFLHLNLKFTWKLNPSGYLSNSRSTFLCECFFIVRRGPIMFYQRKDHLEWKKTSGGDRTDRIFINGWSSTCFVLKSQHKFTRSLLL